jgi:short-subunit dehydrogenase
MKLAGQGVLLTGASGGIGRCVATELARRGARLALAGRSETRLIDLAERIRDAGAFAATLPCDISGPHGPSRLMEGAVDALGTVDVLVNNAGLSCFARLADEEDSRIRRLVEVNLTAPMLLAREVLPGMLKRGSGQIVNVGSALGSIAFAQFAVYSATKFALRGFSEALRRELAGTGITVTYVAPRTTDTAMNTPAVRDFVARTGAAMDPPEVVARVIVNAIEQDRSEVYVGWPERLFIRVNALAPGLVDRALAAQNGRAPASAGKPAGTA